MAAIGKTIDCTVGSNWYAIVMIVSANWTSRHLERLVDERVSYAPLICEADVVPLADGLGVWDAWPVQERDGRPWVLDTGETLWTALAAPRFDDPDERHAHARIHLFLRQDAGWKHLGPAMPEGFAPGSREWSGSAVMDAGSQTLTLYFTAAGRRGETALSFEQRIFSAEASPHLQHGGVRLTNWCNLREIITRDPAHYMATEGDHGTIGTIKAFRDPGYFRDPADGCHYLFFAGSLAGSQSAFNGVVGVATAPADAPSDWQLLPPVISADGLNNELERPHIIYHDGLYYLFWSTQSHVFNPASVGPTGLYGMVSTSLLDGWKPLNGSGLVFANPPQAPAQAYSWLVLPDLSVTSFVDQWGTDASVSPRRFGGTFAPFLKLRLDGSTAKLED